MHSIQKKLHPGSSFDNRKNSLFKPKESLFFSDTAEHSFFSGNTIHPKLSVGQPGDTCESEADTVADRIVNRKEQNVPSTTSARLYNPANLFFRKKNTSSYIQHSDVVQNSEETAINREDEKQEQRTDDTIQLKSFFSKESAPYDIQEKTDGSGNGTSSLESQLNSSKGHGSGLDSTTRTEMESGFGRDFSGISIHTGPEAIQLSESLGAKAFTHGNDIYFNKDQYRPQSRDGSHLLAHELTHTVQQGASVQKAPDVTHSTQPIIQRGLLDSIGSFFSGIRTRVVNFIRSLPGYFLFTVLLGRDPLTDTQVLFNGQNLIKGFLLLLPGGQQRYDTLLREGAIESSANWIDQQLAKINDIGQQVRQTLERAKNSISAGDVLNVGGALDRIREYFNPVIARATSFARRVVRQVLQFLKDAVLNSLVNFIRERTRAYPLLRVLLGRDPVTNEEVPRSMENIIEAFLMLSESGEALYNKMVESGALARSVAWMRAQIATLPSVGEVINAFTNAWRSVSFEDLFQPVTAFRRIYGILSDPIGRIVRFVGAVAIQILLFIKDAMLGWLRSNARSIPGYTLLTVLIGRDVFTNEPVPRTFTNIIHGFMGLIPGGEEQFNQMQESGVIPRLEARISSAIETLGITWDFIVNLFRSIWDSMTITDLLLPLVAFARIIARFREPIGRLFAFIRTVITAVIEVLLRMMNFPIDLIGQIISNAMQAYEDIKRDPIGFLKNLMRAAKKGFQQFFDNFVQHLIRGVTGWLFGELEQAGVQPPPDISFRSILGMALQVLGITVDNIFARLARKIGQERVARIRSMMDRLTGIWEFVRDVIERGPAAIWERIQQQLSNLWDIIVEGIRNWIVTRIVQGVVTRLLSMLDPTGIMAVVNGFITFFRAVQSFVEQLTRILQVINTFVQGVGQIARGNIQQAADFLENALARALPVAIAFLANQVGLRGLGRRIGEMIGRAREVINRGIDWLLDRAIRLGRGILNMARRAAGAVRGGGGERDGRETDNQAAAQRIPVRVGREMHHLTIDPAQQHPQIRIESTPQALTAFINSWRNELVTRAPSYGKNEAWVDGELEYIRRQIRELDTALTRDSDTRPIMNAICEKISSIATELHLSEAIRSAISLLESRDAEKVLRAFNQLGAVVTGAALAEISRAIQHEAFAAVLAPPLFNEDRYQELDERDRDETSRLSGSERRELQRLRQINNLRRGRIGIGLGFFMDRSNNVNRIAAVNVIQTTRITQDVAESLLTALEANARSRGFIPIARGRIETDRSEAHQEVLIRNYIAAQGLRPLSSNVSSIGAVIGVPQDTICGTCVIDLTESGSTRREPSSPALGAEVRSPATPETMHRLISAGVQLARLLGRNVRGLHG